MWRSRDLRLRTVRQEETPESEVLHMPAKENVPGGRRDPSVSDAVITHIRGQLRMSTDLECGGH